MSVNVVSDRVDETLKAVGSFYLGEVKDHTQGINVYR